MHNNVAINITDATAPANAQKPGMNDRKYDVCCKIPDVIQKMDNILNHLLVNVVVDILRDLISKYNMKLMILVVTKCNIITIIHCDGFSDKVDIVLQNFPSFTERWIHK